MRELFNWVVELENIVDMNSGRQTDLVFLVSSRECGVRIEKAKRWWVRSLRTKCARVGVRIGRRERNPHMTINTIIKTQSNSDGGGVERHADVLPLQQLQHGVLPRRRPDPHAPRHHLEQASPAV
jgi:hypothetical protein